MQPSQQTGDTALEQSIHDELARKPGQTVREIALNMYRSGLAVDRTTLNRLLYTGPQFRNDGGRRPIWWASERSVSADADTSSLSPQLSVSNLGSTISASGTPRVASKHHTIASNRGYQYSGRLQLRDWQRDAMAAWHRRGRRGIVEAVTGTGKTHVGLAAIEEQLAAGGSVLVIVPTVELLEQWRVRIKGAIPFARLGLIGDGQVTSPHVDVVIAVINSARAARYEPLLGNRDLIIADECHGCGAAENSKALRETHPYRLGLTATLERADHGVDRVLLPYFGGVVFSLDYAQARQAGNVIAPFRVGLIGVALSRSERSFYDDCDAAMKKSFDILIDCFAEMPTMEDITALAAQDDYRSKGVQAARRWMKSRNDRSVVVAQCSAKTDVVDQLAPSLRSRRSIVFVDRTDRADSVATRLSRRGLTAVAVHSKLDKRSRRSALQRFRDGEIEAVVAARALDEGVDVPAADTAVILASSSTRRQMIQRMGRVLRPKPDGSEARLLIVCAHDTYEDPNRTGRHAAFLEMVLGAAESVRTVDLREGPTLDCFLERSTVLELTPAHGVGQPAPAHRNENTHRVETHAPSHCGRHRASLARPSFLSRVLTVRSWRTPRHASPEEPAVKSEANQLSSTSCDVTDVCSSCGGAISSGGLCRCS